MKREKWSPAEAYWHHYCSVAVNDFFRGIKAIVDGNWAKVELRLWVSDMTYKPYNLEGLNAAEVDDLMRKEICL